MICDAVLAEQAIGRALVELEHDVVLPADDQQGRRLDRREAPCGEVRASAPGDDRADAGSRRCRRPQRGGCAGARTEESHGEPGDGRLPSDPQHRRGQAARKQFDVEDVRAIGLFDGCQQVEEQRSDPRVVQDARHRPIPRAVAATAAAVCEHHDADRVLRDNEVAHDARVAEVQFDRAVQGMRSRPRIRAVLAARRPPMPPVGAKRLLLRPKPVRSRRTTRRHRRTETATRGRPLRPQFLLRFGPSPRAPPEPPAPRARHRGDAQPGRRRTPSNRSPSRRRREPRSCRAGRTERAVPEANGTQFELAAFTLLDGRELVRRHPRGTDDFVVQDAHAALADRTHRELGLERNTELADEDHVEGRSEFCGNLVRDGNPAARQTEDDDPVAPKVPKSAARRRPASTRSMNGMIAPFARGASNAGNRCRRGGSHIRVSRRSTPGPNERLKARSRADR